MSNAFNPRNVTSPAQFGRRISFGPNTLNMSGSKIKNFPAPSGSIKKSRSGAGITRNPRAGKLFHHAGNL